MRKLVVLSCVFLILSGIMLAYPEIFPWAEESTAVSLLHIWAGIFFIVIFPLYSWDHIKGHSDRLRKISFLASTGVLQFIAGIGLIISGIPLLLYSTDVLEFPRYIHFILTFVLAISLILHKITEK